MEEQLQGRERLLEKGLAPRTQVLALRERIVTLNRDLDVRESEANRAKAETRSLARERAQTLAEFEAQAAAEKAEAEAIVATRAEAVRRAEFRTGYQQLTAPVDGIVTEVAPTTIGEVVEAGAPLVTIVPEGEELIVEAMVLNRDAGFVRPGQRVTVKLEAYPFTRHGTLEGVVERISPDAIVDEARGLVFPAKVKLTKSRLREIHSLTDKRGQSMNPVAGTKGGRTAMLREPCRSVGSGDAPAVTPAPCNPLFVSVAGSPVTPGMSAQVEIITGQRTVIGLLSPVARATTEAGRER